MVGESTTLNFNSSKNSYHIWNLRVPDNHTIFLDYRETLALSPWDNFTYLRLVENLDNTSKTFLDKSSSWVHLIDGNGAFKPIYRSFTSRASSITLIFSGMTTLYRFAVLIKPAKRYGEIVYFIKY